MKFEEFVGEVQQYGRLASQGEAMRAIAAVLETLGERLHGNEAENLGAQLPSALAAYLRLARRKEEFDLDEFFRRVTAREGAGVDQPDAVHHARVVLAVLERAVSAGEMADARAQLPNQWDALFEAGPEGEMQIEEA